MAIAADLPLPPPLLLPTLPTLPIPLSSASRAAVRELQRGGGGGHAVRQRGGVRGRGERRRGRAR